VSLSDKPGTVRADNLKELVYRRLQPRPTLFDDPTVASHLRVRWTVERSSISFFSRPLAARRLP